MLIRRRIWKLPPAIGTAELIEPGAATLRPTGVPTGAVKEVRKDPLYPGHGLRPHNRS
jgi:hypothetical protein